MPHAGLEYTPAVAQRTAGLYDLVRHVIPAVEWPAIAPLVDDIQRLKRERNAVVLAHNYMTSDIYFCVGDFRGDSLQLAREAAKTTADVIVQAGVHFMAETSKILSPRKTVLLPSREAGCSLAASITGADVRLMRERHPGVPVVTYVNTTAEVKAESDVTCTSSNAVQVVEWAAREWGSDTVICIPDRYLAQNVAANTRHRIITWAGRCEVHERFTPADVATLRQSYPGVVVLAHPECPAGVVAAADFAGSTAALAHYVESRQPPRVVLLTECSMSDNVAAAASATEFIRPCNLCPHMKSITLAAIHRALLLNEERIEVPEAVRRRARQAIDRMLALPLEKRVTDFRPGLAPADVTVFNPHG